MDKSAIKRPGIGYKHSLIKSRTFLAVVIMLLLFLFSGVVAASGGARYHDRQAQFEFIKNLFDGK